jgi:hypothetical protein
MPGGHEIAITVTSFTPRTGRAKAFTGNGYYGRGLAQVGE